MRINTGIYNTNNTFKSANHTSGTKNKKPNLTELSETSYNKLAALSGLGVLASLGIALTYSMHAKMNPGRKNLKKYVSPTIKNVYNSTPVPTYCGPAINSTSSISTAWSDYISKIERRIDSYHLGNYEKVFTRNSKELDKLEKVANERIIQNNIKPAA